MSYRRSNGPGAGPGSRYPVYPGTGASGVQGHEYLEEENTEKEEEMRKKVRHLLYSSGHFMLFFYFIPLESLLYS